MIYRSDLLSASHSPGKIVLATTTEEKKHFKEQHCCSSRPWLIRQLSVRAVVANTIIAQK